MNAHEYTISIVMSIYKPNLKWFEEQLKSIDKQTYNNIKVYIYNDCPEDKFDYRALIAKYIKNFKFEYIKGQKNIGSNKAFEFLTGIVESEYIAYCDQDDIWLPEKLDVLLKRAYETNADLLCSDMYVINNEGDIIANSITDIRPHQKFYYGDKIFEYLALHNFVTGCTMLVHTKMAKEAVPFPEIYYHDWWIALKTSISGKIEIIDRPLIKYRIHNYNQSEFLKGIYTKEDYYQKWINLFKERIIELNNLKLTIEQKQYIDKLYYFSVIRIQYFKNPNLNNFVKLFKLRKLNRSTTLFELCLPFIPEFIFKFILNQIRKGKI